MKRNREEYVLRVIFRYQSTPTTPLLFVLDILKWESLFFLKMLESQGVYPTGGKTIHSHVTKSIQRCLCRHSYSLYTLPPTLTPTHTPLPLSLPLKRQAPSLCFTRKFQTLPPGGRNNQHQQAEAPQGTGNARILEGVARTPNWNCAVV